MDEDRFNDFYSLLVENGWNVKLSTYQGGAIRGTISKDDIEHIVVGIDFDDVCKLLWFKTK